MHSLTLKIISVVVLLSLVAATLGGVAINGFENYNKKVHEIDRASTRAILGERMDGLIYQVVMDSRGVYMARDHAESEKFAPLILAELERVKQLMAQWLPLAEPSQRAVMEHAAERVAEFVRFRTELVRLSREVGLAESRAFGDNDANRTNRASLNTDIVALARSNAAAIDGINADIDRFYHRRLWLLTGLAVGGILCSLVLALLVVVLGVTRPINRLTRVMRALAAGSTEIAVPGQRRRDEIGEMARAAAVFLARAIAVRDLTGRMIENIRRVAIAATQASQAVSQVSDGSNVQLDALKQSGVALAQSTQAISHVAQSTQLASEGARNTLALSRAGMEQMTRMMELVTVISSNSEQVRQIADAISRIANQTNMLSLNAAIEAARGGEQGRGFAVVAKEVGKLAENSRKLAEDITTQVRQSTQEAERGVSVAHEVSHKMQDIATGVSEGDKLIGAIATAMEEQQVVVSDINRNMSELTRIGQSNATAAEEITATMLDLSRLADATRVIVDDFLKQAV